VTVAMKAKCYSFHNCTKEVKGLLNKLIENFRKILQNSLVGIYLHGSLAMGCFNLGKSDLDIIIVVKNALSKEEGKSLAMFCLNISKEIVGKGLEMSVILENYAKNPVYSMPFEFHYSESWRSKFEKGIIGPFPDEDPDLSAHLRVVYERGITLYGKPIHDVFGKVSNEDYLKALLYDLEDIPDLLTKHPEYYILNLCRVLSFLKTGKVMSKIEGGKWYLQTQSIFKDMVSKALENYASNSQINFDSEKLNQFAKFVLNMINASRKKI